MGRSGGVLWWFFSVWISYICSPSERTGILEITISFMATCRCFTWNTVFWKSIQRLGKLIYTNGGSQKNASSILLLLTSKKWLCVLIPWEAEPHFPTTEWASLLHVFVDVSRETIPLMESILLVTPPCFTWNIGISTSNIPRAYSRVLWKASVPLHMFKSIELISKDRWSVS